MNKVYLNRRLTLDSMKSHLLLGPRRTGKSTLLRHVEVNSRVIDLLKSDVFYAYRMRPSLLREQLLGTSETVVIDEVQLIPDLIREVHWLIENTSNRFILCGSSARKLRREGVTNLAGRLHSSLLLPLTQEELPEFRIERYLQIGGLPPIWFASDPGTALRDYCGEYLKEEIQAEGAVRKLASFTRFLEVCAASNGELIAPTTIGRDVGVSGKTVSEYFQILVDTLLGFYLEPFTKVRKRRAIQTPKFYWFDCGVPQALLGRTLAEKTPEFGRAFEHFMTLETRAAMLYDRSLSQMKYWRSASGYEVDLVIDESTAVEFKSGAVHDGDARGLLALSEELKLKNLWIVGMSGSERQLSNGVRYLPWWAYLERLRQGPL